MSTFSLLGYYAGERSAGIVLTVLGVASALAATCLVRTRGAFTAMAWPFALCALIELGIGAGMAIKSQIAIGRWRATSDEMIARLVAELHGQVKSYGIGMRVELVVIPVAAVLFLILAKSINARSVLLGILIECAALLCFDIVGAQRALQNLSQIQVANQAPVSREGANIESSQPTSADRGSE
jgi:hypothetical protein